MADLVERLREDADSFLDVSGGMVQDPDFCENYVSAGPAKTAAEWVELASRIYNSADRITALEAEIARKDEALRWYRDKTQKLRLIASSFGQRHIISELEKDGGKRARAALFASEIVKEMCGGN